jgi:glycosyltransferase involved in cell wall biosynthesis
MSKLTAVVPAYNEANRIIDTLNKIRPLVDEIIVIDDASTDKTAELARLHGYTVYSQSKNKGYIDAIKYGFREASGEIIITLDADGEFSADEIPKLVQPIIDGHADMVQGHRDVIPRPSERIISWLAKLKANVGDSGTGMRAIRATLAKDLDIKGACICGVLTLEVISRGGRLVELPITLRKIEKPRQIAWFHFRQFFYLLPWILQKLDKKIK